MFAAWLSKTPEIVTLLLEKGADAQVKDAMGKMAIFYAKLNDQLKGTPAFQELKKSTKGWWPFG
jgi:ankyrin repeat protein